MGYFKKRRKIAEEKRLEVMLKLFNAHAKAINQSVNEGVQNAIGIFDEKKYEYEDNLRENLANLMQRGDIEKLVEEVAGVINEQSKVYGYRIAKSKRTELAEDILVALSVKK
jgi:hypothetical protein